MPRTISPSRITHQSRGAIVGARPIRVVTDHDALSWAILSAYRGEQLVDARAQSRRLTAYRVSKAATPEVIRRARDRVVAVLRGLLAGPEAA